ncbi:MAG TPA: ABC transporter permease [Acidothermaceae bacterium]
MVEAVGTRPWQAVYGLPRIVLHRVFQAVPSLLVLSVAGFALTSATPGDPLTARMDRQAVVLMTPEQRAHAVHLLGLDEPLPVQYIRWLVRAIRGDFGYSIQTGQSAWKVVSAGIEPSLILLVGALVVIVVIGPAIGVIAASHEGSAIDRALSGAIVALLAIPPYVLGLVAIFVVSVRLRLLPPGGMRVAGVPLTFPVLLQHLLLPALVLGIANAAPLARYTRASMLEVLSAEYIRTARATGAPEKAVLFRHAYRNASLPIITVVASLIPELFAAAIVTETIFAWPGIGTLAVQATESKDGPVLMLIILIVGLTTMSANLLADILYKLADPRVVVI